MKKTFTKENLLKALAEGAINLLKLKGNDTYVVAILAKDKEAFISLVKNEDGAYAYIPTSYSLKEYELFSEIISAIFTNSVYSDIYSFKPIQRDITTSNVVEAFIPATGIKCVRSANLTEALNKNGYDTSALSLTLTTEKEVRDYSALLADPEVKERFDENRKALVAVSATYDSLNTETRIAHESLMSGSCNGIIFTGPTGTGKSYACRILADHDEAPYIEHQISYGTAVEDILGMFIPNDNASDYVKVRVQQIWEGKDDVQTKFDKITELIESKGEGGNWTFAAGPLFKAAVEGYVLILDEINFGQPGIISKINEFTDTTLYFTLNGKVYRKHPNFVVYMTMNPGYKGTEELNMALKNRFTIVDVPALTQDEFSKRAQFYSKSLGHELSAKFFNKLYDFAQFIKKEGNSSRWHENVEFSIRNAQRLCNIILRSPKGFDDFFAAVAVQYLNHLSVDNDNSEKLQALKKDDHIVSEIRELFGYYDFAKIEEVKVSVNFDDLFSEVDDTKMSSDAIDDKMMDDLYSKF